jgi:hypothetical protein
MDGYDVCLRLRDLGLQHAQLFPVLPFTTTGVMEMLLCLQLLKSLKFLRQQEIAVFALSKAYRSV